LCLSVSPFIQSCPTNLWITFIVPVAMAGQSTDVCIEDHQLNFWRHQRCRYTDVLFDVAYKRILFTFYLFRFISVWWGLIHRLLVVYYISWIEICGVIYKYIIKKSDKSARCYGYTFPENYIHSAYQNFRSYTIITNELLNLNSIYYVSI